eukprot:4963874-Amphidinium_carterae.1
MRPPGLELTGQQWQARIMHTHDMQHMLYRGPTHKTGDRRHSVCSGYASKPGLKTLCCVHCRPLVSRLRHGEHP